MNDYYPQQAEIIEENIPTQPAPIVRKNSEPMQRLKHKISNFSYVDWALWGASLGLVGTIAWATFQDTTPISTKKKPIKFNPDLALSVSANEFDKFILNFDVFIQQELKNINLSQARYYQDRIKKETNNKKNPDCFRRTQKECLSISIQRRGVELTTKTGEIVSVQMTQDEYRAFKLSQVAALAIAAQNTNIPLAETSPNLAIAQINTLSQLLKIQGASTAESQARADEQ